MRPTQVIKIEFMRKTAIVLTCDSSIDADESQNDNTEQLLNGGKSGSFKFQMKKLGVRAKPFYMARVFENVIRAIRSIRLCKNKF